MTQFKSKLSETHVSLLMTTALRPELKLEDAPERHSLLLPLDFQDAV